MTDTSFPSPYFLSRFIVVGQPHGASQNLRGTDNDAAQVNRDEGIFYDDEGEAMPPLEKNPIFFTADDPGATGDDVYVTNLRSARMSRGPRYVAAADPGATDGNESDPDMPELEDAPIHRFSVEDYQAAHERMTAAFMQEHPELVLVVPSYTTPVDDPDPDMPSLMASDDE